MNVLVAGSDASEAVKARADYVCDGLADDVELQAAIDTAVVGRHIAFIGTLILNDTVVLREGTIIEGRTP